MRRPAVHIRVYTPGSGSTRGLHPGALIHIGWGSIGEQPQPNTYQVWVKKGRNTWSLDLGRSGNSFVGSHAYQRPWRIPNPLPAGPGSDYYIRVRNTATGETAHSRFFTISE